MSLTQTEIEDAARDLFYADATGRQIGLLTIRHPAMTMDDAYAVQSALVARKIAAGRRRIGWKIGLTSRAMQDALGIDTPDSGPTARSVTTSAAVSGQGGGVGSTGWAAVDGNVVMIRAPRGGSGGYFRMKISSMISQTVPMTAPRPAKMVPNMATSARAVGVVPSGPKVATSHSGAALRMPITRQVKTILRPVRRSLR